MKSSKSANQRIIHIPVAISYPYYHSILVHRNTGLGITVFDWGVKKFSEYGVDDGFVAKFHAALKSIKEYENEQK